MDVCTNPECRALRKQLERLKSTGYDMLKQRGLWQSHGATHTELEEQFMEFFDDDVYKIVEDKNLQGSKDTGEMLCEAFQEIFNSCRKHILSEMQNALQKVVSLEDISGKKNSEAAYDTTRAYSLLLHATGLNSSGKPEELPKESCQQTLSEKVPHLSKPQIDDFVNKAATLSWDLLTTTPPLVCAQPKGKLNEKWHEKYSDFWDKSCPDNYELVYYRPILFNGSDGSRATKKGFVGSRKRTEHQKQPQPVNRKNDCKSQPKIKPQHMVVPTTYDRSTPSMGLNSHTPLLHTADPVTVVPKESQYSHKKLPNTVVKPALLILPKGEYDGIEDFRPKKPKVAGPVMSRPSMNKGICQSRQSVPTDASYIQQQGRSVSLSVAIPNPTYEFQCVNPSIASIKLYTDRMDSIILPGGTSV